MYKKAISFFLVLGIILSLPLSALAGEILDGRWFNSNLEGNVTGESR